MTSVSDDLKLAASQCLQKLINDGKLYLPVSASYLLREFVTLSPISPSAASFRLTDLRKLEAILEELAVHWDAGTLLIIRDNGEVSLVHAACNSNGLPSTRKRKRELEIDEDADSAEESESRREIESKALSMVPMSSLPMETRETYGLLQRGTAKGKLLAEQVC